MGQGVGLTDKQQLFVYEYVRSLNATEAARAAGYQGTYESLRVIGSQNLTKPHVREAIDELLKENAINAAEVIGRLSDQARGIPADCFTVYGALISVDFDKLREYGLMHLIKKVSYDTEGRPRVEFYDAQTALAHLFKLYNLAPDRVEHSGPDGGAIETKSEVTLDLSGLSADQLAALAAALED